MGEVENGDVEMENHNNLSKIEVKRVCVVDESHQYPNKKQQTKEVEVSNDDIRSEVTNHNDDITSGELTSEDTFSDGIGNANQTSPNALITSRVVLEIPKHAAFSGIRKITFKLTKRKEDYDNPSLPLNKSSNGHYYSDTKNLHFCAPNMELKMSKKVVPSSYPTNVKKLLSTGILDGARVKYVSSSSEVRIHDCLSVFLSSARLLLNSYE